MPPRQPKHTTRPQTSEDWSERSSSEATAKRDNLFARLELLPSFQAAETIGRYEKMMGDLNTRELSGELKKQVDAVVEGSLSEAERVLFTQAVTLNALFNVNQRPIVSSLSGWFD